MNTKNLTAEVAQMNIGKFEFEGLRFSDGSFGIAVSQVAQLFAVPLKNASKDFKALLGQDSPYIQAKTSLNTKAVDVLTWDDFKQLSLELSLKERNAIAESFVRASIGASLQQLYSDAFVG